MAVEQATNELFGLKMIVLETPLVMEGLTSKHSRGHSPLQAIEDVAASTTHMTHGDLVQTGLATKPNLIIAKTCLQSGGRLPSLPFLELCHHMWPTIACCLKM
eukprot:1397840-Amphidinium_carterae.1